jgi:hypothetical protein
MFEHEKGTQSRKGGKGIRKGRSAQRFFNVVFGRRVLSPNRARGRVFTECEDCEV